MMLVLTGCATGASGGLRVTGGAGGGSGPASLLARTVMGTAVEEDFEALLRRAGLEEEYALPPSEAPFTPEDAAALYDTLLERPVTLAGFGPRRVAFHLLGELMEAEEELSRSALNQRLERYRPLALLRPDGYMAWALSGNTQQRVGAVKWKDGAFRVGHLEVGPFYWAVTVYRPVDEQLQPVWASDPLGEVYSDADPINRGLDGAAEGLLETGLAVGQLLTHPVDTLAGLARLPQSMAALIASSPEYWARFKLMTGGEQIQALSKLGVSLLTTRGAAAGTTRTLAAAGRGLKGASVSALSVTAQGTLAMQRVALPVGRMVTALSGGPGAALILHRTHRAGQGAGPAPSQGPGQWAPARESMSRRAARYQQQICGRPVEEAYWVGGTHPKAGGVRFDGFEDGVLLEAKGLGYANKFNADLSPKRWFEFSGAEQLREQARRQLTAARGTPIRWHVAEEKAALAIRKLLSGKQYAGIEVVYTRPL